MNERVRQLREPAIWVALGVCLVLIVLAWVRFGVESGAQVGLDPVTAALDGVRLVWGWPYAVLGLLDWLAGEPQIKYARWLLIGWTIVLALTLASSLGFLVIIWVTGVNASVIVQFILLILDVLVKGIGLACLAGMRGVGKDNPDASESASQAIDPRRSPVWRPEDAVGLQWDRAGDAASGGQANRPDAPLQPGLAELSGAPEPPRRRTPWSRGAVVSEQPSQTGAPGEPAGLAGGHLGGSEGVESAGSTGSESAGVKSAQPARTVDKPAKPWATAADIARGDRAAPSAAAPKSGRTAPDWTPLPRE